MKKILVFTVSLALLLLPVPAVPQCIIPAQTAVVKTASYAGLAADTGKMFFMNCASACTFTLPSTPQSPNWFVGVFSIGAGVVTISPNGLTLNGSSSNISLSTDVGSGGWITTDNANYFFGTGTPGASVVTAAANFVNGNLVQGAGANKTASDSGILATAVVTDVNTKTLTNKTADAEGTGNVMTRPFYIAYSPACNNATPGPGSFNVPTSAAATFSCSGTTTTEGNADFVDGSTTTLTTQAISLPQGWTGNVDVRIVWYANSASANAVRWSVASGCVADGAAINTGPSYNTATAANTAYTGTANQRKTTLLSAISAANCASGNSVFFQVQRIGADAGDTLTATAELLELQVEGRATK